MSVTTNNSNGMVVDTSGYLDKLTKAMFDKATTKGKRRAIVRKSLKPMRQAIQRAYRSVVHSNKQKADIGVKVIAWRNSYGGSVSLCSPRKKVVILRFRQRRRGGRSGIIRDRYLSERTKRMRAYYGASASYLLRWVNNGTKSRETQSGHKTGSMPAKSFFIPASNASQAEAVRISRVEINNAISNSINKK